MWDHDDVGGEAREVMGAVAYRVRSEVRAAARGAIGIVVLVALLGGLVLATVAGARRTMSAYPRMRAATVAPEILVAPPGAPGADPSKFYDAIADVEEVDAVGLVAGMNYLPLDGSATAKIAAAFDPFDGIGLLLGSVDGITGYDLHRPIIIAGRLPDASSIDEVLISRAVVRRTGLGIGDVVEVVLAPGALFGEQSVADATDGPVLRLEVVGEGTFANEVIAFNELDELGVLLASPAVAALQDPQDWGWGGAYVHLRAGADVDATSAAIGTLGDDPTLGTGGPVFLSDETAAAADVQAGMRPIAVSLVAAAVAIALVGLVVVGQALARHTRPSDGDLLTMRSIGFNTLQRTLVPLGRTLTIGVAGAVGAVIVAIALSPRFPVGPARVAERDLGLAVDTSVLLLGGTSVALLSVAVLVPTAVLRGRRKTRRVSGFGRAATSAAGAARLPTPVLQGVRFAFGAGPDGSPPTRSALVVAALAVTAVLGSAAFARGLTDLVDDPHGYGQGWDLMVDAGFAPAPIPSLLARVNDEEAVEGIAVGNYGQLEVGGAAVPAIELAPVRGKAGLTMLAGEVADDAGEIVLGGEILDQLHLTVGDEVDVDAGAGVEPWKIVGSAVFPRLGRGGFNTTGLGLGAQVAPGPLPIGDAEAMLADSGVDAETVRYDGSFFAFMVLDLDDDADVTALTADLDDIAGPSFAAIRGDLPPTTIRDLDRVRDVPVVLAGVLALIAAAALAHQLAFSVRARKRELALLRTLGFTGSQLRSTIVVEGALLAAVALIAGVPVGLSAGRLVWRTFAEGMHVDGASAIPWAWVVGAPPVALLAAAVLAAVPATRAAGWRAAPALREETRS